MKTLKRYWVQGNIELQKIFVITICWVVVQSVLYVHEYYSTVEMLHLNNLANTLEFWPDFMQNLMLCALGAMVGAAILVSRKAIFENQTSCLYSGIGSGLHSILFYVFIVVTGLLTTGFDHSVLYNNIDLASLGSLRNSMVNLSTPSFIVTMIIWGLLVFVTQFALQINDKFGHGVLWKFLIGQYSRPREEERIFMFLDLKGATTIAENMESGKFFAMLKEVYKDITRPIVESLGEIYQYVGDEVVISWSVEKGIKNNNVLRCFYRIEKTIERKKTKYLEKYGIVPTFKAGLHLGKATIGEIGVIKKEIVYSGDVLNTTSRIQALCNHYNVRILISSALLQLMKLDVKYTSIPMGEIALRGKEQKIALNTIQVV